MQLQDAAAREWADAENIAGSKHEHCFSPDTNTSGGHMVSAEAARRYAEHRQSAALALAEYNAGRGNVLKWNKGDAVTNSAVFVERIGFRARAPMCER